MMIKMPAPKPKPKVKPRRRLRDGYNFPHIETYRQTNGKLWLSRFRYGKLWITGVADDEASVIDNAQQFYMTETKQGQDESEVI